MTVEQLQPYLKPQEMVAIEYGRIVKGQRFTKDIGIFSIDSGYMGYPLFYDPEREMLAFEEDFEGFYTLFYSLEDLYLATDVDRAKLRAAIKAGVLRA